MAQLSLCQRQLKFIAGEERFMNLTMKRVFAGLLSLIVIFTLSACKVSEETSVTLESTTILNGTVNEVVTDNISNTETPIVDTTIENNVQETSQAIITQATTAKAEVVTTESYDDPVDWSKERIVEEYKNAAIKSTGSVKSSQKIVMKEININDGENAKMMSFIKSVIAKFLESNSTTKDGITGGFENLVPEDINSAKAYKSDDGTVIEMLMVEQVSGAKDDALSGSVGHAITTVGDISTVVTDLNDRGLSIELSENEEDTKIYYTNPVVNVVINDNGEIVKGTWSCTVEICMNNFKAFGKNVDKASIVMENTITV